MNNGNRLTGEIIEQLSSYMITEVTEKAVYGITYSMFLENNAEDKRKIEEYTKLKQEIDACGIDSNSIFQKLKVSNGYVFNLEVEVARKVMAIISERVYKYTKGQTNAGRDLFLEKPTKRRKEDIEALAKLLIKEYNHNNPNRQAKKVEVALYSRNSSRKIMCMAKDSKGNSVKKGNDTVMIELDAFAIRHRDISEVSQKLLQKGYKLVSSRIGEILPSKTGVRFVVSVDKI